MSVHAAEHEEFLASLLDGTRRPGEAEVEQRLGECAICHAAWTRLRAARARLEQAAADRRGVLEDAARGAPAAGEEELLATLERLAREEPHARPRLPDRRRLVAAAALLVGSWGLWVAWRAFAPEPSVRPKTWLGRGGLELLEPIGPSPSFARFAWTYNGEASGFALRVYRARGDERGELLFEKSCETTVWTPEPSLLASLPGTIRWEVDALDEFGVALDSAFASASR